MIKSRLLELVESGRNVSREIKHNKAMLEKISTASIDIRELSHEEKRDITLYWKQYGIKPNYPTFRWYYSVNGIIDPKYISEGIYTKYIWTILNDMERCKGLNDKNLLDLLYGEVEMPETILHNICGTYLDEQYHIITQDEAVRTASKEEMIVIKPSVDSCQGKGIICVRGDEFSNYIAMYKRDYIVQKVIKQHESFSTLNESSVNVVRMTSLLIEGEVIILDSIIRIGAPGKFTDHKNVAVGINNDGTLKKYGYSVSGTKVEELSNGVKFSGHNLIGYDNMRKTVAVLHARTPQARIIGWDLTTDYNGNVVVIEANMDFPGIIRGQDCNGPFFGEYTDKVLKFCKKELMNS